MQKPSNWPLVDLLIAFLITCLVGGAVLFSLAGCDWRSGAVQGPTPKSSSGVGKVTAKVNATATFNGKKVTAEQYNILARYDRDDDSTATKHLYVISTYSGDCILYSTVRGKVTSSGKRLTPYSIIGGGTRGQGGTRVCGIPVVIGDQNHETTEVLQDDGTYGSSIHYLYWFDARGAIHKHYISGGQIVHVSDTPMAWPKIILNLETAAASTGK
jgi:hypothetical protein